MLRPTLALLLVLGLPGLALADVVWLRDGRRLEGTVTLEQGQVVVRLIFGEVRLDQRDVLRIETTRDPADELAELRAELAGGTAEERYRFACRARELGFEDEARRALLSVLRLDVDHPGARAALGYVLHDGRWVTEEDLRRAQGLVPYRGEWVTPAERAERERAEREAATARREDRERAAEQARAEREARREAERAARRERIAAAERADALARARAREEEAGVGLGLWGSPTYDPYPPYSGCYGGTTFGRGRYRVLGSWLGGCGPAIYSGSSCDGFPGTYGSGYYTRSRYGLSLSGTYDGGDWQLRWRIGADD